jgi:ferritin
MYSYIFLVILFFATFHSFSAQNSDLRSKIRYKISPINEEDLNKQINLEYDAMHLYDMMAAVFDSSENPMPGCSKLFQKKAGKQRDRSRMLMTFVNQKGGSLKLVDIRAPLVTNWDSCSSAMNDILRMETQIRLVLHEVFDRASDSGDVAVQKLASELILDSTRSLKHTADIIRQFQRATGGTNDGLGNQRATGANDGLGNQRATGGTNDGLGNQRATGGTNDGLGNLLLDEALGGDLFSVVTTGLTKMPLTSLRSRSSF